MLQRLVHYAKRNRNVLLLITATILVIVLIYMVAARIIDQVEQEVLISPRTEIN